VADHLDEKGPPDVSWMWEPIHGWWPGVNTALLSTPVEAFARAATLSREMAWQSRTNRHPSPEQVHEAVELLTLLNTLIARLWPITNDDLRQYLDRQSRHMPRGRMS
jgi:hypothetical protein